MKSRFLTTGLLLLAASSAACSSFPERPGSQEQGTGGYAQSRNQASLIEAQRAWDHQDLDGVERALTRWQGPMDEAAPLVLLGQVAFSRQQFGLSAELFTQALSYAPNSIELHLHTAQAQEVSGRWDEALQSYERTLQLQGNRVEAALGILRARIARGEGNRALQFARDNETRFSNHAEYLRLAADLAFFEGDLERCIAWSQTVEQLGALAPEGEERYLLALAWSGQHEAALTAAGKSARPEWAPEVHRTLGRSAIQVSQGPAAVRHFQDVLTLSPEDPIAWLDLARAQFLCGNTDKALASSDQALARDESSAQAQLLRAHCLFRLGQDEDAAQAYFASIASGADAETLQPFLDQLVMREMNSLKPRAASAAKEMTVSPQE